MHHGEKLQVFVLGCYTNAASALLLDPSIKDKVSVHLMGFNFLDNQLSPSKFNSLGDLHAAASLIKSGVELKVMVNTSMQKFRWKKDDVVAHFNGNRNAGLNDPSGDLCTDPCRAIRGDKTRLDLFGRGVVELQISQPIVYTHLSTQTA